MPYVRWRGQPRRIRLDHPKLEKMAGDALGIATVKRALTGADVVSNRSALRPDWKRSSSRRDFSPKRRECWSPQWTKLKSSA